MDARSYNSLFFLFVRSSYFPFLSSYLSLLFLFFFVNKSEIWDRPTPLWPMEGKKQEEKSPNCIDVFLLKNVAELTGTICALLQGSLHLCFALRLQTHAIYVAVRTIDITGVTRHILTADLSTYPYM